MTQRQKIFLIAFTLYLAGALILWLIIDSAAGLGSFAEGVLYLILIAYGVGSLPGCHVIVQRLSDRRL